MKTNNPVYPKIDTSNLAKQDALTNVVNNIGSSNDESANTLFGKLNELGENVVQDSDIAAYINRRKTQSLDDYFHIGSGGSINTAKSYSDGIQYSSDTYSLKSIGSSSISAQLGTSTAEYYTSDAKRWYGTGISSKDGFETYITGMYKSVYLELISNYIFTSEMQLIRFDSTRLPNTTSAVSGTVLWSKSFNITGTGSKASYYLNETFDSPVKLEPGYCYVGVVYMGKYDHSSSYYSHAPWATNSLILSCNLSDPQSGVWDYAVKGTEKHAGYVGFRGYSAALTGTISVQSIKPSTETWTGSATSTLTIPSGTSLTAELTDAEGTSLNSNVTFPLALSDYNSYDELNLTYTFTRTAAQESPTLKDILIAYGAEYNSLKTLGRNLNNTFYYNGRSMSSYTASTLVYSISGKSGRARIGARGSTSYDAYFKVVIDGSTYPESGSEAFNANVYRDIVFKNSIDIYSYNSSSAYPCVEVFLD